MREILRTTDNLVKAVEAAYENPFSVEKAVNNATVAGVKQLQSQLDAEKRLHKTAMQFVEAVSFPIGTSESQAKATVRFNRLKFRPETNLAPDLSLDPSANSSPSWDAMARGVLMSARTALSATEFISQFYPIYQRSAFLEEATEMAEQIRRQIAANPALKAQLDELESIILAENAAQVESWKKVASSLVVEGIPLTEKLGVSLDNLGLLSQTLSTALLPIVFVSGSLNVVLEGKTAKKAYHNLKSFNEWQQAIVLPSEEVKKKILEALAHPPKQRDEKQEALAITIKKGLLALEQKKLEVEGHFLRRGFNSLVATIATHMMELTSLLILILLLGVSSPFVGIPVLASFLITTTLLAIGLYALKKYRPTLYQGLTFNAKLHLSQIWNQLKKVWKESEIEKKIYALNKQVTKTLREVAALKALDKARLNLRKGEPRKADPLLLEELRKGAAEIKQLVKEHQQIEKRCHQLEQQIESAKWKDFTLQARIAEDSMEQLAKALRQLDHNNPHQAEITAQLKRMGIAKRTEAELKHFFMRNEKEIVALAKSHSIERC